MYHFALSNSRPLEAANYCIFQPCLHPSRTMDVHDFIYMIDGVWSVGLGDDIYEMHTDDVLILPAHQPHFGVRPCTPKTRTMYFHVYSHPDDGEAGQTMPSNGVLVKKNLSTAATPNIKRLFEKIIQTMQDPQISTAYINVLLYELSEISVDKSPVSLARAIHDYMVSSDRILTNGEIAAHFYVSKRTAETVFKSYYGQSIHDYMLTYKLNQSRHYLLNYPDLNMTSIAQALGFYDEFHYGKMFKRAFGISPGAFRKHNSGSPDKPSS